MYNNQPAELMGILRGNAYPGRGILLGKTPSGHLLAAYFIMGRSPNSKNRVFVQAGEELLIRPFCKDEVSDPTLILYRPARRWRDCFIVSNGDQTETIHEALSAGRRFEDALRTRRFEPDAPHFTPRISGLLCLEEGGDYTLSILRASDPGGSSCDRLFFEYAANPGEGRFLHTYERDAQPLPSFYGEPARIRIPGDAEAFAADIWESLNRDYRIALCLWEFHLKDGTSRTFVFNRHVCREGEKPCGN